MTGTTKFVRYSATVDDMSAAWAFVMDHIEEIPRPRIEIQPFVAVRNLDYDQEIVRYDAVVSGDVA